MAPNEVTEEKKAWKYVVFGFLTLGIYDLICLRDVFEELDAVCGYVESGGEERSPDYGKFVLLTIFTLGIYCSICYYRQGNRLHRAGEVYGVRISQRGGDYALWYWLGLPLLLFGPYIALYLLTANLNKAAAAYRYQAARPTGAAVRGWDIPNRTDREENGRTFPAEDVEVDDSTPTESILVGTIQCIRGQFSGGTITMNPGEELIIGRNAQTSQIVLPDKDISRAHCAVCFILEKNAFSVTDLSTYQTTYLNDTIRMKKGESRLCPPGSKLTLGNGKNQFLLK